MSPARLGPWETAAAMTSGVVARRATRDIVRASGPDALSYLQGQCTQDLTGLAPGTTVDSFVLSTQGKVDALVRISMVEPDELLVQVAAGFGPALHDRLRRFKIRVKADLELLTWPIAEVRGPDAEEAIVERHGDRDTDRDGDGRSWGRDGIRCPIPLGGEDEPGFDLLGSAVATAEAVPEGDEETFEAARIEAGLPAMGHDLDERTIPQESGIVEATVSFTKGCYTGQELVARIDARGSKVPKLLRSLVVDHDGGAGGRAGGRAGRGADLPDDRPEARPEEGSVLVDGEKEGEKELGRLTSLAWSPARGSYVGLGYVRREVVPPARLVLRGPSGQRWPTEVSTLARSTRLGGPIG